MIELLSGANAIKLVLYYGPIAINYRIFPISVEIYGLNLDVVTNQ